MVSQFNSDRRFHTNNTSVSGYVNFKELDILSKLCDRGILPESDTFQITEDILQEYMTIYHKLYGKSEIATGNKSNTKFARRLAGRTLVHLNASRGISYRSSKAGLLYLIGNHSFPEHYKIGITVDIEKRLAQYQTYDPHRSYKVIKYDFVLDKSLCEKRVLSSKVKEDGLGEWLLIPNALALFEKATLSGS